MDIHNDPLLCLLGGAKATTRKVKDPRADDSQMGAGPETRERGLRHPMQEGEERQKKDSSLGPKMGPTNKKIEAHQIVRSARRYDSKEEATVSCLMRGSYRTRQTGKVDA